MALELKINIARVFSYLLIFALLTISISCSSPSKPAVRSENADYIGTWTSPDETTLVIRADGSCDYLSATETVTGARMKLDKANGKISFNEPEKWRAVEVDPSVNQLKLDGVIFRRVAAAEDETKKP